MLQSSSCVCSVRALHMHLKDLLPVKFEATDQQMIDKGGDRAPFPGLMQRTRRDAWHIMHLIIV